MAAATYVVRPVSQLAIRSDLGTNQVIIEWASVEGLNYTLLYSTNLVEWLSRAGHSLMPATAPTNQCTDEVAPASIRFYRLREEE